MNVSAPKWRFEWNPNTIAILVGFAVMIGGWGYNYSGLEAADRANASAIEQLRTDVSNLNGAQRTLDNHEIRLTAVETQARDSASSLRSVEQSLNALATDVRVTREILERLERSQTAAVVADR